MQDWADKGVNIFFFTLKEIFLKCVSSTTPGKLKAN